MDQEKIKTELDRWLVEFVEVNNPQLNDWAPCPYAKAARLSNMIDIKFATVPELNDVVLESLNMLETKDVVVICFDHTKFESSLLQDWVRIINISTLIPADYVILEDHPDAEEHVNGINMNFGHCGLLVLQKLSKLNNAADKLKGQGYYDTWDQRALSEVVNWRYKK